jgi:hypothetical protein
MLRAQDSGVIDDEELEMLRNLPGSDENTFAQEFGCDFNAAVRGAFYGNQLNDLEAAGHMGLFPYDTARAVHLSFDIGYSDDTSIWFYQTDGKHIRVVDFFTVSGYSVDDILHELQSRPYAYGVFHLPHDAANKSFQTGKSVRELFIAAGCTVRMVPNLSVQDGIQAVRKTLPNVYFNTALPAVKMGVDALRVYQRQWDDKRGVFKQTPLHDWCFTGDTEVLTRYGTCQIMNLPEYGEVLTLCGWKQYTNPRITRKGAPLVAVRFEDGLTVRCTPDHLFLTESGWKCAEHLVPTSTIQSSLTRSRSTLLGSYTASLLQIRTIRRALAICTEKCGKWLSAPSRKIATFTTSTLTRAITSFTTLSASIKPSICSTHGQTQGAETGMQASTSRRTRGLPPPSGTDRQKADFGISSTQKSPKGGLSGSGNLKRARVAALRFLTRLYEKVAALRSTARTTAKPLRIESVSRLSEMEDVWCLTVPESESFSLSNGAIVHNCSNPADSFRYLSLAVNPASARREGQVLKTHTPAATIANNVLSLEALYRDRKAAQGSVKRI